MTSTQTPAEQARTVLITGSTSGIGAATARTVAAQGWRVVVTGRDRPLLSDTLPVPSMLFGDKLAGSWGYFPLFARGWSCPS